jgi:hypothetical protein
MPPDEKPSDLSEFSLSGLHKHSEQSSWLNASDTAELALLLNHCGQKFPVLPVSDLIAVERAMRKLGTALYAHGIPHYVIRCRPSGISCAERRIILEVAVPQPKAAFDLLCAGGFRPDPMRALSVTGRRGLVCIRLVEAGHSGSR